MAKYQVIRAWYGKKVGDIVEIKGKPHRALASHVRPLSGQMAEAAELVTGDTQPSTDIDLTDKAAIVKELKRLKIDHDGRDSPEKLAALLPR